MKDGLIPINITKAKVTAIVLQYKETKLEFNAEVSLIDDYGKCVTSIHIGNGRWEATDNAELSLSTIELAKQIRSEIEISVIRFMNSKQKVLEHQ